MSADPTPPSPRGHRPPPSRHVLFPPEGAPAPEVAGADRERNWIPWVAALIVIVVIIAIVFFISYGSRSGSRSSSSGVAPYASHLAISDVHLSRATNFAGNQLTYVDGTISNHGDLTVTGVTVRLSFTSLDPSTAPQEEQVPVQLIRTRQPYIDTEPVSAEPLMPGTSHDFRLIFDNVSPMWDQHIPSIEIQSVATRK